MPTYTSGLALPYPTSAEQPDGPGAFAQLANRLEATVGQDSNWITVTTFYWGFAGTAIYRRMGRTVTLSYRVYSGGTGLSATYAARGILILPVGFRPSATLYFPSLFDDGTSNGGAVYTTLDSAGNLTVSYGQLTSAYFSATVSFVLL